MRRTAIAIAALFWTAGAMAASSDWFETTGARIAILVNEAAEADGTLRGALVIDLEPGWKTYWRDPGDAGVPPTIDTSGSINVGDGSLAFPAPQRFSDDYSTWAGYGQPVALPITLQTSRPTAPFRLEASVFLGVCETICVPVQARLSVSGDAGAGRREAAVDTAFAMLPDAADAGFGVTAVRIEGEALMVEVAAPGPASDFFVASDHGWYFAMPEPVAENGMAFRVPVLGRSDQSGPVSYTLVAAGRSVSGTFELP